jgi:hypothetical protein
MRSLLVLIFAVSALLAQSTERLADIRKVYVEKMDNDLDQYLRSAISKKFHTRLTIVLDPAQADAILKGVNMQTQHTETATVNLIDPHAKVVLWSGTAGDRNQMLLNIKHGGSEKIAEHLAGQLKKAMER